jgi:serine/threonine protein kinase
VTSIERSLPEVPPYRILEALGQGATAEVFRAVDSRTGQQVVLKLLFEAVPPQHRRRFAREIKSLSALAHPSIVRVLDSDCSRSRPWYAMEYLPRQPLDQWLRERHREPSRPIELAEVRQVLADVASALEYAHGKQIVHRDLKPSNVLVDAQFRATLIDFGIVKLLSTDASKLTATGAFLGTPLYAAPEQVRTDTADARCDLYSFGLMAYELLTGKLPFSEFPGLEMMRRRAFETSPPPSTVNPRVPPGLDRLVLRCLEPKPENRYQTMAAVCADLEPAFATGTASMASPATSRAAPPKAPAQLNSAGLPGGGGSTLPVRIFAGSVLLGLCLVLAALGARALRTRSEPPLPPGPFQGGAGVISDFEVAAGSTSATVAFRTAEPATVWLRYAPTGGAEVERVLAPTAQSEHRAELLELTPATEYRYRIVLRTAAGQRLAMREQYFRTKPRP